MLVFVLVFGRPLTSKIGVSKGMSTTSLDFSLLGKAQIRKVLYLPSATKYVTSEITS